MDWRNIRNGYEIPSESYSDQPYIIKTNNGDWLCQLTTGSGEEGRPGQHIISIISSDKGKTWSKPLDIESACDRESSYGVLVKGPNGRIFCFYNYNTDNVRNYIDKNPIYKDALGSRVDMMGDHVFKYSDDDGKSWSTKRIKIPIRNFSIDNENLYNGELTFFWNVGKPFILDASIYISIHKVGYDENGYHMYRSEGVLVKSTDLLHLDDPRKATWITLPEGDIGLRNPKDGGLIAEEQSYVVLSDKSIFCIYRTSDGSPACSYSRDGAKTWSEPLYAKYDDASTIKHPRAANFVWKCENGKYLYWFHNNFGKWFADRNPVWMCSGEEIDTPRGKEISWSQPDILLYDDDPYIRMSYPDLIIEEGEYYISETQKDMARVHHINSKFLNGLFNQKHNNKLALAGLVVAIENINGITTPIALPNLKPLLNVDTKFQDRRTKDFRHGFTIEFIFEATSYKNQLLLDNRDSEDKGFYITLNSNKTIEIFLNDGRSKSSWVCDINMLEENKQHHVSIIIDGGPKVIMYVIDGKLCDGAGKRQFGWGRYNPNLRSIKGSQNILPAVDEVKLKMLRVYDRALTVSESIANWNSIK